MSAAGVGVAVLLVLGGASTARAANFAVDNLTDPAPDALPSNGCEAAGGDECTLREAILAANVDAATDSISFGSLPGSKVIAVSSALPAITQRVNFGQGPLGGPQPQAGIDGPGPSGGNVPGLEFDSGASNSSVGAFAIGDFDTGIRLSGADNVQIGRVHVGLALNDASLPNGNAGSEQGIIVTGNADANQIGVPGGGNTIVGQGNGGAGVGLSPGSDNNLVQSNLIGTDGPADLGNGGPGIAGGGASGTTIVGNTIAGNGQEGILIAGPGVVIRANSIGTTGSTALGNSGDGIRVTLGGVATIGGPAASDANTISANGGAGVKLEAAAAGGSVLQRNFIGTDNSGNASGPTFSNGGGGVFVTGSPNNRIGTPGAGNLVSNNGNEGIRILDPGSTGTRVEANVVGLSSGGGADGNTLDGIRVGNGASGSVIGSPGAGNVVGANGRSGIQVEGAATTGTVVQANVVGVNQAGTGTRANGSDGIQIDGAPGAVVGGLGAGEGNLSSANTFDGIDVENNSDDAVVRGNTIGTNAVGTLAMPNQRGLRVEGLRAIVEGNFIAGNLTDGIELDQGDGFRVARNRVGQTASGALIPNGGAGIDVDDPSGTIGGPGDENTIVGNLGDGIFFHNNNSRTTVAENSIFANGGLGIDLEPDGLTANDAGDGDIGPNTLQNTPIVASAVLSGGQTAVAGTIATSASTPVTVRFFASSACDPSGSGEGERFLGATSVSTDGAGNASLGASLPGTSAGEQITATATGPGGTSEFSPCRVVETPGPGVTGFGAKTNVSLSLAAAKLAPGDKLQVRVKNANAFQVTGTVSVETKDKVSVTSASKSKTKKKRIKLGKKSFKVSATAKKTIKFTVPKTLQELLRRKGKLVLSAKATVSDPRGQRRTVKATLKPKLKVNK